MLHGSSAHILQLFQNLLSNSLKFRRPDVPPRIEIAAQTVAGNDIAHPMAMEDKRYISIEVKDNGIGFEQRYEEKIFQMFQHLHGRNEYSGRGIGLTICKRIIENYDGFIITQSEPGRGSSFVCYFPEERT